MICPLCPESITFKTLDAHLKIKHGKIVKDLRCKHAACFRLFSTLNSYKTHVNKLKHYDAESKLDGSNLADSNFVDVVGVSDSLENEDVSVDGGHSTENTNFNSSKEVTSLNDIISSNADIFVAKQYANPSIPRCLIQSLIEETSLFMNNCIQSKLRSDILQMFKDCNASSDQLQKVTKMFDSLREPFAHLSREHKRLKYYQELGFLVKPKIRDIGGADVVSIPLKKVLKNYLELPDVFDTIISYIASCQTDDGHVYNFMQCPLWQTKRASYGESDIVLPLNVFIDAFQCNNPLGSHSKSLDGVYVALPCLPPEFQACVDNIFLAQLYPASIRKDFSDDKVYSPLISQLSSLAKDGIVISTPAGDKKVYIVTAFLLGDNNGLQSVSGFAEGFTANYFCRFCKTHRDVTYTQTVQDDSVLRTKDSYDRDVSVDNVTLTGVNFDSAFNKIPGFHVTSNYVVDPFHDLAEGVCHYVLLHVLKHCIPRYFTVDDLNHRISFFDWGTGELSNRIPLISNNFATKDKLRMSGSETLSFVRFLGILIGDRVPEHDPYWQLYLKLRHLLDVCLAKSLNRKCNISLKVLVEEFNSMYVSVTNDTLKPKMHFLLHYFLVFEKSGVIDQMSTRRYEGKHRSLTVPAHSTMSRVQISYTCALRHQLAQFFRFYSQKPLLSPVEVGPSDLVSLNDFENINFRKSLPDCMMCDSFVVSSDWVKVNGIVYKPGMVLITNVNDNGPVFSELKAIFVKDSEIVFAFLLFLTLGFNEHIHAYSVAYSDMWSCKPHKDLFDPFPLYSHDDFVGDKYVVLRYGL